MDGGTLVINPGKGNKDFNESRKHEKRSFPKGRDRIPKKPMRPIMSHVVSVESYAWRGYNTATLGNVLDMQFVRKVKMCRGTQTNWNWRKMAERWGGARLMEPSEEAEHRVFYEEPIVDIDKIIGGQYSSVQSDTSGGESSTDDEGSKDIKDREKKKKKVDTLKKIESGVTVDSKKKESKKESKTPTRRTSIKAPEHDVKFCRPNDKCIDTNDLDFDPFDPSMRYTRKETSVKPFYMPPGLKEELGGIADDMWPHEPNFNSLNKGTKSTKSSKPGSQANSKLSSRKGSEVPARKGSRRDSQKNSQQNSAKTSNTSVKPASHNVQPKSSKTSKLDSNKDSEDQQRNSKEEES